MPRYTSGLAVVDGVALGRNAGAVLTEGTQNVLLGPNAGSALTTGSNNVIIGGHAGPGPTASDRIVLSTGAGTARAVWDDRGDCQLQAHDVGVVAAPATAGWLAPAYDTAAQVVTFRHHDGTAVRASRCVRDADLALVETSPAATGSVSVAESLATRQLRRLRPGANIQLDATSTPGHVTISTNLVPGATNLDALSDAVATATSVALGSGAACGDNATATNNTVVGAGAGTALTTGGANTFVGQGAGSAVVTGASNVIVGRFAGTAALTGSLVLADGAGRVRLRWDDGATSSGTQSLDTTEPASLADNQLAFVHDTTTGNLRALTRVAGTTRRLEIGNERPLGTTLTASANLAETHRNRFTQVVSTTASVVITVVAYANIANGAEHEFLNRVTVSGGTLTFAAGTGVTILSVAGRVAVTLNGAVVLKYLGSNVFSLIGAIE